MSHHCHARGCATPCKPEMLMCLKHWRMVPRKLQRAVWATYRPGQCDDKQPSVEWHEAADAAIAAVAAKEAPKLIEHTEVADPLPDRCPRCGGPTESGFGLAGGGFGSYVACDRPGCDFFAKVQSPDEIDTEAETCVVVAKEGGR